MGFFKANFKTSEKGERNFNQPRILIISVLYFEKKFYKWNRYFLSLFETQIDKGLIFDNDSRWSGHKPVLYILNFFTRKKLGCSFSHFFVLLPFWKYISNLICFWCWQQQNGVWQGKFFVACLSVHILSSLYPSRNMKPVMRDYKLY